jgi:hypothetical protein
MRGGLSSRDFRRLDQLDAPGTQKLTAQEHHNRWCTRPDIIRNFFLMINNESLLF